MLSLNNYFSLLKLFIFIFIIILTFPKKEYILDNFLLGSAFSNYFPRGPVFLKKLPKIYFIKKIKI